MTERGKQFAKLMGCSTDGLHKHLLEVRQLIRHIIEDIDSVTVPDCGGLEDIKRRLITYIEKPLQEIDEDKVETTNETARLKESLYWTLAFIRGNCRKGEEYPEFKQAESLVSAADITGPFWKLQAERDNLASSMEHYADKRNWRQSYDDFYAEYHPMDQKHANGYDLAREVLSLIRK